MRTRIVALATLAAVLAIVLFGVPLAGLMARYLRDDERQELEQVADTAAVASSIALARSRRPGAMPETENDTGLALYDTTGHRLSGTGPAGRRADPQGSHRGADRRGEQRRDRAGPADRRGRAGARRDPGRHPAG
jgi:hypothetical protein